MSDFKNLKSVSFDNVKIRGMYESKLKPLEIIVNVNFSLIPKSTVSDILEFKKTLVNKLGLFTIDRHCKTITVDGWKYDGSRYTYEHNIDHVKPNAKTFSSFGIDLYFVQKDKKQDIKSFYKRVCEEISRLEPFQTDGFVTIRANRKSNE